MTKTNLFHRLLEKLHHHGNTDMSIETGFASFFVAIEHGAASVYHQVVATGVAVSAWEEAHPEIQPLIAIGQTYATSTLTRFGVPVGAVEVVGSDVLTALKQMAARDATVQSGSPAVAAAAAVPTAAGPLLTSAIETALTSAVAETVASAVAETAPAAAPAPAAS
jgi:hypothetical protein